MLRNARIALFNALDYALHSELSSTDLQENTAGCKKLHDALQESLSQRFELIAATDGPPARP
jgi:hypothetical protein